MLKAFALCFDMRLIKTAFGIIQVLICSVPHSSIGQIQERSMAFGIEYNYYPAGQIVGLRLETLKNNHHGLNFRMAANMAKRKDFSGLNDNEHGWGPGISFGYRYYLDARCSGLFLGARADIWRMNIHWIDSSETIKNGMTKLTVLQPTFEIGYEFDLPNRWRLGTAFVNGFEMNVVSKGEDVGQGWITLWQLRISKIIVE